ncbi:hypothetical protein HMPREF1146_0673 [Prevotella sp. MSX73]|nr:hypothetical protein HMPREF1146_0673 [Prevotella sp. MSX73]
MGIEITLSLHAERVVLSSGDLKDGRFQPFPLLLVDTNIE